MNAKNSLVGPRFTLETIRTSIDLCLQSRLNDIRTGFATTSSQRIVDEVVWATVRKGGRIRPLLCCCGYAASHGEGGPLDGRILCAASSLELLHTFAILHDDVMDGSPTRRGEPSTFVRVAEEHRAAGLRGDSERYGVSVAVLAGDLALVISDLLLAESGFDTAALARAAQPLSRMRLDAIAGQYLDLSLSGRAVTDPNVTARIARLKTGSYSVEGPLLIGAALAGASESAKRALEAFAGPLGEAFQLTDDLLGMFGDPAVTGKSAENDLRQGKPTSLMARALSLAAPDAREMIMSIWGNPDASQKDLEMLRKSVHESGAVRSMVRSINQLVTEAKAALKEPEEDGLAPEPCRQMVGMAESIVSKARKLQKAG